MWSYECNPSNLIDNFSSAAEADVPSRGGWSEDFTAVCSKYKIPVPCPYIKVVTSGSEVTCSKGFASSMLWLI